MSKKKPEIIVPNALPESLVVPVGGGEPLVPESEHNRVVAELEAKRAGADQARAAAQLERDSLRAALETSKHSGPCRVCGTIP